MDLRITHFTASTTLFPSIVETGTVCRVTCIGWPSDILKMQMVIKSPCGQTLAHALVNRQNNGNIDGTLDLRTPEAQAYANEHPSLTYGRIVVADMSGTTLAEMPVRIVPNAFPDASSVMPVPPEQTPVTQEDFGSIGEPPANASMNTLKNILGTLIRLLKGGSALLAMLAVPVLQAVQPIQLGDMSSDTPVYDAASVRALNAKVAADAAGASALKADASALEAEMVRAKAAEQANATAVANAASKAAVAAEKAAAAHAAAQSVKGEVADAKAKADAAKAKADAAVTPAQLKQESDRAKVAEAEALRIASEANATASGASNTAGAFAASVQALENTLGNYAKKTELSIEAARAQKAEAANASAASVAQKAADTAATKASAAKTAADRAERMAAAANTAAGNAASAANTAALKAEAAQSTANAAATKSSLEAEMVRAKAAEQANATAAAAANTAAGNAASAANAAALTASEAKAAALDAVSDEDLTAESNRAKAAEAALGAQITAAGWLTTATGDSRYQQKGAYVTTADIGMISAKAENAALAAVDAKNTALGYEGQINTAVANATEALTQVSATYTKATEAKTIAEKALPMKFYVSSFYDSWNKRGKAFDITTTLAEYGLDGPSSRPKYTRETVDCATFHVSALQARAGEICLLTVKGPIAQEAGYLHVILMDASGVPVESIQSRNSSTDNWNVAPYSNGKTVVFVADDIDGQTMRMRYSIDAPWYYKKVRYAEVYVCRRTHNVRDSTDMDDVRSDTIDFAIEKTDVPRVKHAREGGALNDGYRFKFTVERWNLSPSGGGGGTGSKVATVSNDIGDTILLGNMSAPFAWQGHMHDITEIRGLKKILDDLSANPQQETPTWIHPSDWTIGVSALDDAFADTNTHSITTNTYAQILGVTTRTVTQGNKRALHIRTLDPFPDAKIPDTVRWSLLAGPATLTPAGISATVSATGNGIARLTAEANGILRPVTLSFRSQTTVLTEHPVYLADVRDTDRAAANDTILAALNKRDTSVTESAGITPENATCDYIFATRGQSPTAYSPVLPLSPHLVACLDTNVNGWGSRQVAVAPHFTVTANHWTPAPTGRVGRWLSPNGTVTTATTVSGIPLADWARKNGYSESEIQDAGIADIYLFRTDKPIPDDCLPYVIDQPTLSTRFNGSLKGVACYAPTQHGFLSYSVYQNDDGTCWEPFGDTPPEYSCARQDIHKKLTASHAAMIHGGDSGLPILFACQGHPVITSIFKSALYGSSFVRGADILDAAIRQLSGNTEQLKRITN